jgi:hypothetical protein
MRVEVEIFAKGVEREEEGRSAFGEAQGRAEDGGDGLLGDGAEALEETAMAMEEGPQELRQGQDEMPVGDRQEDVIDEMGGRTQDLSLVAGGTEPPALAGEGEQVFVLAVIAANAGEALFQGPALEELFDDFRDDGSQGTQFGFVGF